MLFVAPCRRLRGEQSVCALAESQLRRLGQALRLPAVERVDSLGKRFAHRFGKLPRRGEAHDAGGTKSSFALASPPRVYMNTQRLAPEGSTRR